MQTVDLAVLTRSTKRSTVKGSKMKPQNCIEKAKNSDDEVTLKQHPTVDTQAVINQSIFVYLME